jgi:dihydroorotate dehydrogenase
LSLSIKEARSDIAFSTPSTLSGVLDRGGLSGMGPSHSSVRMLSSERRLSPEEATLIGVGSINSGSGSDSGS